MKVALDNDLVSLVLGTEYDQVAEMNVAKVM